MVHLKKKQKGDKNEIDLIYSVNLNMISVYSFALWCPDPNQRLHVSNRREIDLSITYKGKSSVKPHSSLDCYVPCPLSSLHTTTLQITKEGQSHEKQQQPPFSLAIRRGKISRSCRMACPSDGEDEMESAASDHS